MMNLYSGTTCPFSQRCRIVLYEKGMDFQIIDVELEVFGELFVEEIQADQHPVPVGEIADDPPHRWGQDLGQGGGA